MCTLYTYTNTYMPRFSPSGILIIWSLGLREGMEAEKKKENKRIFFWYPAQNRTQPEPDGPNASDW